VRSIKVIPPKGYKIQSQLADLRPLTLLRKKAFSRLGGFYRFGLRTQQIEDTALKSSKSPVIQQIPSFDFDAFARWDHSMVDG
jgi:hypothetical protein